MYSCACKEEHCVVCMALQSKNSTEYKGEALKNGLVYLPSQLERTMQLCK